MPESLVPRVDPITLEIIRGSLASAIRDMELLMERCAMSPFIKEKKDYFVGIFDTRGRIVACHISGSGPGMLQAIMKVYPLETMRPGDVYWFNDPYISDGAVQHHQDMVFAVPIFHAGRLVAFSTTFGHYQDIGGLRAGSISPHATEIYHEGVLVPPVRIVREGQLNEEAYRIFLRNSRLPDLVEGDTRAMMASCRLAETRLGELCGRYGVETVLAAFDECIAQTARRARELFLELVPSGEWRFHDFLDSDGGTEARPYRIDLTLSRQADHVRLDGSNSADPVHRGPGGRARGAALRRRGRRHLLHRAGELPGRVRGARLPVAGGALRGAAGLGRARAAPRRHRSGARRAGAGRARGAGHPHGEHRGGALRRRGR